MSSRNSEIVHSVCGFTNDVNHKKFHGEQHLS